MRGVVCLLSIGKGDQVINVCMLERSSKLTIFLGTDLFIIFIVSAINSVSKHCCDV
uniref:Uncharacterized protein n=1 Tax=Physcomitrium patens TaxID=3218 RepID=A0A2K1J4F7_PHYPA|nr:hypothetical protein PHYPA_022257 [Physcomitrium patens]